jgi:hypothetical protein
MSSGSSPYHTIKGIFGKIILTKEKEIKICIHHPIMQAKKIFSYPVAQI